MRTQQTLSRTRALTLGLLIAGTASAQLAIRHTRYLPSEVRLHSRLLAGDFDKDGDLDFVSVGEPRNALPEASIPAFFENDGMAHFRRHVSPRMPKYEGFVKHGSVGDVDADGDLDIVAASRPVSLWLNDGKAKFTDASAQLDTRLASSSGMLAELLDVDRDGDLDLLNSGVHGTTVALNDGKGNFTYLRDIPTHAPSPTAHFFSIASGDIDGDKKIDLVLSGIGPIVVMKGDDKGNFAVVASATHKLPTFTGTVQRVLLADLDKDGDLDLVCAHYGNPTYSSVGSYVFLNDGKGAFTDISPQIFTTQSTITDIGLLDFDRDGDLDILRSTEERAELYEQHAPGSFRPASATPPADAGWLFRGVYADFDGDGYVDILGDMFERVSNGQHLKLWLNDRGSGFVHATRNDMTYLIRASNKSAFHDLDDDGHLDFFNAGTGVVYWNNGQGEYDEGTRAIAGRGKWDGFAGVGSGDLDGDGDVDAVFSDGLNFQIHVLLNDGKRNMRMSHPANLALNGYAFDMEIGDVDGDKNADLVAAVFGPWPSANQNNLFIGDGTGNFRDGSWYLPTTLGGSTSVEMADFDRDGDLDLFFTNYDNKDYVHLNNGRGDFNQFTAAPDYPGQSWGSAHLDADLDGDVDLVVATNEALVLLENDGKGKFTVSKRTPPIRGNFRDVTTGRFSGDPFLDLVVIQRDHPGELRVFHGIGPGVFRAAPVGFVRASYLLSKALGAADIDGDGDDDLFAGRMYRNYGRQLQAMNLSRLGSDLHLESWHAGGGVAVPMFAPALAKSPLRIGTHGWLQLDLASLWFGSPMLVPSVTAANWKIPIPAVPALHGARLHLQALQLAPPSLHWTLSNRVSRRLSY